MTRDLDGSELPLGVGSLGEVNLQGAAAERREPGGTALGTGGACVGTLGAAEGVASQDSAPSPKVGSLARSCPWLAHLLADL